MKKVLFVATVVKTHIMTFHLPYLEWFKVNGFETHVCAKNDYINKEECNIPFCDNYYDIPIERSPLKLTNLIAYRQLKSIIESNKYDIIHCHTPMGGAIGRLAAINARQNGTKVIYTAHGFHFYNGAPFKNWLIYYNMEKWLAKYTDVLVTINSEDYKTIINKKFYTPKIKLVNGVGINLKKFKPQNLELKNKLREEFGFQPDDFILVYVGELSYRKHQDLLIKVVKLIKHGIPNLKLLLVGSGKLSNQYKQLANKLSLNRNVEFLGYRNDVSNIMLLADIAVSSSRQEGLPVNVMEAMATGLPLVVTDCRGNRDLVVDGENGYVIGLNDIEGFANALQTLYNSKDLRVKFGQNSIKFVKKYSIDNILNDMGKIYLE